MKVEILTNPLILQHFFTDYMWRKCQHVDSNTSGQSRFKLS